MIVSRAFSSGSSLLSRSTDGSRRTVDEYSLRLQTDTLTDAYASQARIVMPRSAALPPCQR